MAVADPAAGRGRISEPGPGRSWRAFHRGKRPRAGARRNRISLSRRTAARRIARQGARRPAHGTQDGDPALLAALKALRLRLARERQVPAYVIFSDRTLIDMAARAPRDLDAFAEVNGVGAAKLKDFGGVF